MAARKDLLVQLKQPRKFGHRLGIVFNAQIDVAIVPAVSGLLPNNHQRGRLFSPLVTARLFASFQRREQPVRKLGVLRLAAFSNASAIFRITLSPARILPCTVKLVPSM